MNLKYADIPEDIKEHVRINYCCDCEGQTVNMDCDTHLVCDGFIEECERLVKEQEEEERGDAAADMQETHRRLTRDMVNDWRRANP